MSTSSFLPPYLQTIPNRRFLQSTLDLLVDAPELTRFNGYIGRQFYNGALQSGNYLPENTPTRQQYQLEAAYVTRDNEQNITATANFLDLLNSCASKDAVTSAWNRLLTSNMYSWQGFMDLDKVINYYNYIWLPYDSWYWNRPVEIAIATNQTIPANVIGAVNYTDINGVTLMNGMLVYFNHGPIQHTPPPAPYGLNTQWIVEGVGKSIVLVNADNILNPAFIADQQNPPDYLTVAREAVDKNLWSRTNLWVHKDTINAVITVLVAQLPYSIPPFIPPTTFVMAQRPIIEFEPLLLFGLGKYGLDPITYFDNYTGDAFYNVQGQTSYVVDGQQLNDGDSVVFNADASASIRANVYNVSFIDPTLSVQNTRLAPVQAVSTTYILPSGLPIIDGYACQTGDRILLIGQYVSNQNGIYLVSEGQWTIAPDWTAAENMAVGVLVLYGNFYAQTYFTYNALSYNSNAVNFFVSGKLGVGDGLNKIFSLPTVPYANTLLLWNNYPQIPGVNYSISGNIVTYTNAPVSSDILYYQYQVSTATPISTPVSGIPSGVKNGSNTTFTMAVTPNLDTLIVWNNYPMIQGIDYTISGNHIVFTSAPLSTDNLFYQCETYSAAPNPAASGIPTGTIDGSNKVFSLPFIPDTDTLLVWNNYLLPIQSGYTLDGSNIIFNVAPVVTDNLYYQCLPTVWTIGTAPVIQLSLRDTAIIDNCGVITGGDAYTDLTAVYNGNTWDISPQNKNSINQAPLFDMFDLSGTSFGAYSTTSFTGSKLFSYQLGTGTNDSVLGFPLSYGPIGNLNDVLFQNNYITDTFSYNNITHPIAITGGRAHIINPITNMETPYDCWQYVNSNLELYQNYVSTGKSIIKFTGNLLIKSTENALETQVYVDGALLPVSDYTVVQAANNIIITISSSIDENSIVLIKILSSTAIPGAWYDVPSSFDHNPLGQDISVFDMGSMREHARISQENTNDTTGIVTLQLDEYAGVPGSILYSEALSLLPTLLLTDSNFDIDQALRTASEDYTLFKQKFLTLAGQILVTATDTNKTLVDKILQRIALGNSNGQPWVTSDMCYWGGTPQLITITNTQKTSFNTALTYNWDSANAQELQVYLNNNQLILNQDYTVSGNTLMVSAPLHVNDSLSIYEIANTDGSYIPATPTKLGLAAAYLPQIYTDYSYQTPRLVLQGHDGSITACFGDYRDELLLDYELRVYNNLKVDNQLLTDIIESHVPSGGRWRSEQAISANNIEPYSPTETLNIQQRMFFEWAAEYNVNYVNSYYDSTDPFTWNWSSSTDKLSDHQPLLGYWRGIYNWFLDSENPNTRPWEMLNLAVKPTWWDTTYGPAPYTGQNTYMWNDIAAGIVRNPMGITQSSYGARTFPNNSVLSVIPVDDAGNLLDPNNSVVGNYNVTSAAANFVFGDGGPAETAWRRSSAYPYAKLRAQILRNPLFMCGALWNTNNYLPTVGLNQFRFDGNYLGSVSQVIVNGVDGNGTARVHGLLNYTVEYLKRQSVSPVLFRTALSNSTPQLIYPLGGYSSVNDLFAYGAPNNPLDVGADELIPVHDYTLYLNQSTPIGTLNYSGLIITALNGQYQISGYNRIDPFFMTYPAQSYGPSSTVGVRPDVYKYPLTFTETAMAVPYNTVFPTIQSLVNFIAGYDRFLTVNGLTFTVNASQSQIDWPSASTQFIKWALTNWNTITPLSLVLNPSASIITYTANSGTLYNLTDTLDSTLLDSSGDSLESKYLDVYRDGNEVTITHQGGGVIACVATDIISYEQRVIFDNTTAFNDTIYNPVNGVRQIRLKFSGQKSANWDGTLASPGFMISTNTVPAWIPNHDYLLGSLIQWKNNNYVAIQNVIGASTFQYTQFKLITTVFTDGILPNLALKAADYSHAYDTNYRPFITDLVTLRNNTIGYIERDWLSALAIDSAAQTNFYKGWIKEKGTVNSLNSYGRGSTPNFNTQVVINEEYAVKVGVYGSDNRTGYGDISLPPAVNTVNPLIIEFVDTPTKANVNVIQVTPSSLYEKSINWTNDIAQNYGNLKLSETRFTSAGPIIPQQLIDFAANSVPGFNSTDSAYLFFNTPSDMISAPQDSILKLAENKGDFWIESNPNAPGPNQWDVITFRAASTGISSVTQLNANTLSITLSSNIGAVNNMPIIIDYIDYGANIKLQGTFMVQNYYIAPTASSYATLLITANGSSTGNTYINYPAPVATSGIYIPYSLRSNSIAEINDIGSLQFVVNDKTGEACYVLNAPFQNAVTYPSSLNDLGISSLAYDPDQQILWSGKPTALFNQAGLVEMRAITETLSSLGTVEPVINTGLFELDPLNPYTRNLGTIVEAAQGMMASTANSVSGTPQIYFGTATPRSAPKINQIVANSNDLTPGVFNSMAMSQDANWLYVTSTPLDSTIAANIAVFSLQSNPTLSSNSTFTINTLGDDYILVNGNIMDQYSIQISITGLNANTDYSTRVLIPQLEYSLPDMLLASTTMPNDNIMCNTALFNIGNANYAVTITNLPTYYKFQGTIPCPDTFAVADNFGASITCNDSGSILCVGAPNHNNGAVAIFNRITENQYISNAASVISTLSAFTSISSVSLNGVAMASDSYNVSFGSAATINFATALPAYSELAIAGQCFSGPQTITAPNTTDSEFGACVAMEDFNLIVGSPRSLNAKNVATGAAYHYALDSSLTTEKIIPVNDLTLDGNTFLINGWAVTYAAANLAALLSGINAVSGNSGITANVSNGNLILSIDPTFQTTGIVLS